MSIRSNCHTQESLYSENPEKSYLSLWINPISVINLPDTIENCCHSFMHESPDKPAQLLLELLVIGPTFFCLTFNVVCKVDKHFPNLMSSQQMSHISLLPPGHTQRVCSPQGIVSFSSAFSYDPPSLLP